MAAIEAPYADSNSADEVFICVEGGRILNYRIKLNKHKLWTMSLNRVFQIKTTIEPIIILSSIIVRLENSCYLFCCVRGSTIYRINTDNEEIQVLV
jgi:hypothetical protein